uniref:Glycosyltransferase n=1 Tax=viral metagenome TaxID=1070528 RepID=A0A6C0DC91_9ZZZZ
MFLFGIFKKKQNTKQQVKKQAINQAIQTNVENYNFYSIIPLNLFQTWHTLDLPPKMKNSVELLKRQNPEFTYYLYDDKMCRDFIEQNYDKDVLYSFDKLKPGAYKSDLWRYCVLYKYGGIYLDIKFSCVNGFKLKYLTNKEYFVRDRIVNSTTGIYQAFLVTLPNNTILYNCIQKIVENVKNNVYNYNPYSVTGPQLMSSYFNNLDIDRLDLWFDGNKIIINKLPILSTYSDYRKEQFFNQKTKYYYDMWNDKSIYNYPILNPKTKIDLSKQVNLNILGQNISMLSSTPTIIDLSNNYLINIRWINYNYNEDGSKKIIPKLWLSANSRHIVDASFNKINDEIFLEENYLEQINYKFIGLEDIRIFNFKNDYYYIATYFDKNRNVPSICSGIYNIKNDSYNLNKNIILPKMYDLNKIRICEKNWSFVIYKNELCIVYKWFPLQIGKIDYEKNEMNIIDIKYNVPYYFKDARGSTSGVINGNEIWFVIHKTQSVEYTNNKKSTTYYNYQHFFAVFDLDMNLIRYSELFKFEDCKVEFCIGIIIKNNDMILSYSALDTKSIIATYDIDYINNNLKWYLN